MNTRAVVPGSLSALAQQNNMSVAESFLSADVVILVDVSGSMAARDSRGGRSRYDIALEELARLQKSLPGRIAVVSFSNEAKFCPGGVPQYDGGGTYLTEALNFVQIADGTVRFIVVSDGCPENERSALAVARQMTSQIDTVFVGPENDIEGGRAFLEKLAHARGGQSVLAAKCDQLAQRVETLLLSGA